MQTEELKQHLLTLRSVSAEGEQVYKTLLILGNRLTIVMTDLYQRKVRIKSALDSSDGRAFAASVTKATELVPWFENCKDLVVLVIAISKLVHLK